MADYYVSNGESLSGITLLSGDTLTVDEGGTISDIIVRNGAKLTTDYGVTGFNITFKKGGQFGNFTFTAETTAADLAHISNVSLNSYAEIGNDGTYETISRITINNNGFLDVGSDGSVSNVIINNGGRLSVYGWGTASGITVKKGGMYAGDDSAVTDITFYKGAQLKRMFTFTADTKLADLSAISNVSTNGNGDTVDIGDNPYDPQVCSLISNITVQKNDKLRVWDSGTVSNVTLNSGATLKYNGGTVSGITAKKGARIDDFTFTADTKLADRSAIANVTLMSDGDATIGSQWDTRTVSNITVAKDAHLSIADGGTASRVTLAAGARLSVAEDAVVSNITVKKGAQIDGFIFTADAKLADFSNFSNVVVNGDAWIDSGCTVSHITVNDGDFLEVGRGGKVRDVAVKGGELEIRKNATASQVVLSGNGRLDLERGGNVTNLTVGSNAVLNVYGGKVSNITVKKGAQIDGFTFSASKKFANLSRFSGVSVANYAYIGDGRTISDITIRDGAWLDVYEGGTASGVTVQKGAELHLYGGKASRITVKKGGVIDGFAFSADTKLADTGNFSNVTVSDHAHIGEGQTVSKVTVSAGAELTTYGGTASSVTVKKGGAVNGFVFAANTTLSNLSSFSNVTVDAWASIDAGQSVSGITVAADAELVVESGGKASGITVKKGGILNGVVFTANKKFSNISEFFSLEKADNTNDTWKAASKQTAVLTGETVSGWVGYNDAKDFIKVSVKKKGRVSLALDAMTASACQSGELKLSLLNSSGKAVALADPDQDTVASKSAVAKGTYYLGIACTDVKKYYTDYSITTGLLATA